MEVLLTSIKLWQERVAVDLGLVSSWIVLFALFLLFCVLFFSSRKSLGLIKVISNHLLSISLIIWILGVIVYLFGLYRPGLNCLSVMPRAIISSFKMFVVTHDLARVPDTLQRDVLYMSMFSLVHFAAAFITFLFIFKMIGYKIKSSWNILWYKWLHAKGKNVHLFWGVNEPSCLLAEDIRKKYHSDTIIFIDVDDEREDDIQRKTTLSSITNIITIKNTDIVRLEAIGALVEHCYNGPAALNSDKDLDIFGMLQLKNIGDILIKSNQINMYFLVEDESKNIAGALNLQKDKRLRSLDKDRVTIYIHARRDANNEVFDHYSQYDSKEQKIKIKIVDSAYLSVAILKLKDKTLPVNCVEIDKTTGLVSSSFTSLIIGFGGTGQEAFKFLYEYAAFVGKNMTKSPFKCYAIDENMNKIAGLFKEKIPAITDDELVLINTGINSEDFWSKIKNIGCHLNYVVIALNNDELGLSIAVNLFKYVLTFRCKRKKALKIMLRCYDNCNEKRMMEVMNNLNKSVEENTVEIQLFGKETELYSCNTILSDTTLFKAKEFNRVYENSNLTAEEQWQKNFGESEIIRLMTKKGMSRYHAIYDINRRIAQNISNSLHCRTKMILMGLEDAELFSERLRHFHAYVETRADKTIKYACEENYAQLLINIAMVEHERWIASHKLMGYTYNIEDDYIQKHHKCICPWDNLDEWTKSYDCNVVDTSIKLTKKL